MTVVAQAPAPAPAAVGSVWLNVGIFLVFVLITLVFVYRASRTNKTASDYYAAGRAFTGPQNGVAIAGDYLSAASFLGIAGAIGAFGGVLVNLAFRQSFLQTGTGNAAYIAFIAFYAVCFVVTWVVYLRPSEKRLTGV